MVTLRYIFTVNTARVTQRTFADNFDTNELEHKHRLSETICETSYHLTRNRSYYILNHFCKETNTHPTAV